MQQSEHTVGDRSTPGTYIRQGSSGATPPGREPRGACPQQGEYGCSAPAGTPLRPSSGSGAGGGSLRAGEARGGNSGPSSCSPEAARAAAQGSTPGLPPCALSATSWMFGSENLTYFGARFSVASVSSFHQDLEGVHDPLKGEKGHFFQVGSPVGSAAGGRGQLWRAPRPVPAASRAFPKQPRGRAA